MAAHHGGQSSWLPSHNQPTNQAEDIIIMAIYYVSRIVTEDCEVVLEDFGAVIHDEAINTHEELIELVTTGELSREGEVPEGATLTVQTYRCIDDVVVAESRLEHNGEHYETTHTIGYSYW